MKILQHINISSFQQDLLNWYDENKRDLPWRKDQDPYKIWVSEIMLQQTRVDTVIPFFHNFMKQFPTIDDLAEADLETVLKAWEGLGYYSRARNLHEAVREVVQKYHGEVPSDPKKLASLKGIGPYTKGAILSIAFNQPEPAVDGNVMRVLSRILRVEENISEYRVKKQMHEYAKKLISKEDPSSFNQAIMELGALICTPRQPTCTLCPVQKYCTAYQAGVEEQLPIKSKAKKQKTIPYVVLTIKNEHKQYVIEQRPTTGLLANLWQFPMVPIGEVGLDHIENWFFHEYGIKIALKNKIGEFKHVFSHLIWDLTIYEATLLDYDQESGLQLATVKEFALYPFPSSHLNVIKLIKDL